jgi:exonuclease SbcC
LLETASQSANWNKKIQEKPALQKELDQVNLDKTSKELEITKNDDSYKVATQTLANLKSQSFDLASIMQERITLGNEIESATESVLDLTQRLVNNQKLLSEESVIREAAKLLTVQLELSELKSTELQEAKSQYEIEATSVKSELYALRTEVEGIDTDLSTLSVTTKERTESLSKSESEIASLESKLTQFQNKASLLERVPCSGVTVNSRVLSEECELLKDAVQGKKEISAIEEILIELRAKRLKLWKEIDSLVKEKENLDRKKFLKSDLIKNLDFNFQNSELGRKIKDLELESGAIQVDITKLREQTKNLAQLDFAQERIDGYKKQIAELTQSKDAKSTRLTEIQTLIDSKSEESKAIEIAEQELKNLESNLKSLKSELETLIRNASRIDEKLSEIQKSETKLKSLKESDKSHKLTGLKLLCEGLSPKGARALMIDAAGPGISASINSVLSAMLWNKISGLPSNNQRNRQGDDQGRGFAHGVRRRDWGRISSN